MLKFVALFAFLYVANGARILGIVPMPSFSHQNAFWPIWRELSLRGHKVTVLGTDAMNDVKLINLTEITNRNTYKYLDATREKIEELSAFQLVQEMRNAMARISNDFFNHKEIGQLINGTEQFDLVMVETFFPEFLFLGEKFQCPTVLICSLDTSTALHSRLGNQLHGVAFDEYNLPFYGRKNFLERLVVTLYHVFIRIDSFSFQLKNRLLQKYLGETAPTVEQLLDKVDMTFLNSNPVLASTRALSPSTITFGGAFHIGEAKPLPKDLKDFLDGADEGAIYFSLGSNARSTFLKEEKKNTIINILGGLPYKVLWKFEDDLPNVPSNIKLVKWAPQQDILRHPNVKLFITQAGLQSMEEAIHNSVPMVTLPIFGDQITNAKRLHEKEVGIFVEHMPILSGEKFKEAILEVIRNPKYKENIKELNRLLHDVPMTGLEKVVWWTEYVIRNKGAKHLRNSILDIPVYQYYYLDIIGFFLVVLFMIYNIVKFAFRWIIGLFTSRKDNKKNR